MPRVQDDPVVCSLIDELTSELETKQRELEKVIPLNITDDPYIGTYNLLGHPVKMSLHPATLRGAIAILEDAVQRLKSAETARDIVAIYKETAIGNIMKAEYCSTHGRVTVALRLRDQLDHVMNKIGINSAPKTATSTSVRRNDV
jgi:hypothetical protein